MNAFKKWVGFVLFLGFLWLGVPKCTEIPLMSTEDRQKIDLLCKMVESEYAVVARPDMLRREEWLLVLARYRRAEALEMKDLDDPSSEFPNRTGPLLEDLARRMERR
jgi:hypothetical protein